MRILSSFVKRLNYLRQSLFSGFKELSLLKKVISIIVTAAVLVIITTYVVFRQSSEENERKKNITVHYIGRYTSEKEKKQDLSNTLFEYAKFHEVIFRKFLSDLEMESDIWKFNLVTHDNNSDPETSKSIYQKIAKNEMNGRTLILDNSWGKEIKVCNDLIKQSGIPVIALNADHNQQDFGNNAVFIGNDDNVPKTFAQFISNVLGSNKINFISEKDYPLHERYLEEFKNHDIEVLKMMEVFGSGSKINKSDKDKITREFEEYLSKQNDVLLVLNVHSDWGSFVLNLINNKYDHIRVLSPSYSTTSWTDNLSPVKSNEFISGILSEDAISKNVLEYIDYFRSSPQDSLFTRINIHEFITDCMTTKDLIRNYVTQITEAENQDGAEPPIFNRKVITNTEVYDLIENGQAIELNRDLTFSKFRKGALNAYPIQINKDGKVIPNVFFGMEIESIYELDLKSGRFGVDFYYWLKYDSIYSKKVERMVGFSNLKIESRKELMNQMIDSNFEYRLYKVSATCNQEFNLEDYPIDDHELRISAQILDPKDGLRISFDKECLSPAADFIDQINLENWNPTDYTVTVDNTISKSARGLVSSDVITKSKTLSFWIHVKRESLPSILGFVLPLSLIGFIAIGMMFLRERNFELIGDATAGLLISTILFSLSLTEFTPASSVLKKTDWVFWITLIIVLLNFIIMVFESSIFQSKQNKSRFAIRFGCFLLIAYPSAVMFLMLS